jgi:hypothetical protein
MGLMLDGVDARAGPARSRRRSERGRRILRRMASRRCRRPAGERLRVEPTRPGVCPGSTGGERSPPSKLRHFLRVILGRVCRVARKPPGRENPPAMLGSPRGDGCSTLKPEAFCRFRPDSPLQCGAPRGSRDGLAAARAPELTFGSRGRAVIECHHTKPLHTLVATRLDDLALVCANCHRLIHGGQPWLTLENLRQSLPGYGQSDDTRDPGLRASSRSP